MAKHYVTFGFDHKHNVNGLELNKDCVAVFDAATSSKGRDKAFKYFGNKFCFEYHDKEFDQSSMVYFPKGFINVEKK